MTSPRLTAAANSTKTEDEVRVARAAVDIENRTRKFTDAEFSALSRYPNGRIIDFSMCFMWLTKSQVDRLHSDDWSYMDELEEEVRIMAAEFQ